MDLIYRKQAIDAIDEIETEVEDGLGFQYEKWREHFSEMPSAQPDQKKGRWIPMFNGKFTGGAYWFSCSKCKRIVPEVRNGGWNFCPNCGADMRGGKDE